MIADITHNLAIRVVPVNQPREINSHGEQMGFYRAYVTAGTPTDNEWWQLSTAENETNRGIVPMMVGYGSASNPRRAIDDALVDYQNKFGKLCEADTKAA